MTTLRLASYQEQRLRWPTNGRHIMAQYDEQTIVVYQAYRPAIGHFAARNNYFGGDFSYSRMSWIKPNFLWMMYRSGWGTKPNQEVTLAIHLKRTYFDVLLREAVASSYSGTQFATREEWQRAVANSDVRSQWDPDHNPSGGREERRAVQLGLRGQMLQGFKGEAIISIEDISGLVAEQQVNARNEKYADLVTPFESVYPVTNSSVRNRLGMNIYP
ncbi:MAG: DUF4291 domain-containing protein [Ardenticatenaceae bacterium]|nr:DUF4291 domain-containing protein [Ardenticatenaceae bacterium]